MVAEGQGLWYAAYGSNLWRTRFEAYLGGKPIPGGEWREAGCRDPRPPRDERARFLPHACAFAGHNHRWHGGTALLDHRRDDASQTLGRLWLIGRDQFADLVRQANRAPDLDLDLDTALAEGAWQADDLHYGRIQRLEDFEGRPVLTITSPEPRATWPLAPPSRAYLFTLACGLVETYHLNKSGLRRYLQGLEPVAEAFDGADLNALHAAVLEELAGADGDG